MTNRYVCIHGHFYQPPRENAWFQEIEIQESAYPYHDWNERITDECYGPNSSSRILNEEGKIVDIVNNYSNISFNFGPTLLSWLEQKTPKIYQSILDADALSLKNNNGHGNAIAQVYNHVIMPLASELDKNIQVYWGIKDFEKRFKRKPEGMWLAETAVDIQTLEILANHDIRFTILAHYQCKRYKNIDSDDWVNKPFTEGATLFKLPSGKTIYLFFYNGPISQQIAFNGLLNDGKSMALKISSTLEQMGTSNPLLHIATDGETYGHHHKNGDMALAYCIKYIETQQIAKIINYGYYLELFPPVIEVEINENTSWSCSHGIERWRNDCGCNSGKGYHQLWRKPLREALNWLRDEINSHFETVTKSFNLNPLKLRLNYIENILDPNIALIDNDLINLFGINIDPNQIIKLLRLLEAQKNIQLMYTSCAWFFDEVSGIETIQILQYANRAIQLVESESDLDLETTFLDLLELVPSNLPDYISAKNIYLFQVTSKRLSLTQVGMHYAVSSIFSDNPTKITILNYECNSESFFKYVSGNQILTLGQTVVKSKITRSKKQFSFVLLYLGNHQLIGNTSDSLNLNDFNIIHSAIQHRFNQGDLSKVIEIIKENFTQRSFSFFDLFKDEQLKLLKNVLQDNIDLAQQFYEQINNRCYDLLNVMKSHQLTIPSILKKNHEMVTDAWFEEVFVENTGFINIGKLKIICDEIIKWQLEFKDTKYQYQCSKRINDLIFESKSLIDKSPLYENIFDTIELLKSINITLEINELQNELFHTVIYKQFSASETKPLTALLELVNLKITCN